MVHLVCFHLSAENQAFEEAIKAMGPWSNRVPGSWIVETILTPRQVRDRLGKHLGAEDRLFVARISRVWASRNLGPGFPDWMERRKTIDPASTSPEAGSPAPAGRKVPQA
ncbi:MAG: hypothetical protein JXB39_10830 [Deltaproteobacteria bacterium]|nr:hypothetical protein [Deltaproteobacteria bacterium]